VAAITRVCTIDHVAEMLGEEEDWLPALSVDPGLRGWPPVRLRRRPGRSDRPDAASSFDCLVGTDENRLRKGEAERLRGL
jgi:hypothetical protein